MGSVVNNGCVFCSQQFQLDNKLKVVNLVIGVSLGSQQAGAMQII